MPRNSKGWIACLLTAALGITGCATAGRPYIEQTALQIRALQTHDYDGTTKQALMQAVLGHLQDDGYIIQHADREVGFLTARKEEDARHLERSSSTAAKVVVGLAIAAILVTVILLAAKYSDSVPGPPSPVIVPADRPASPQDRIKVTECTVSVTPNGSQMRLRVNFQEEVRNDVGVVTKAEPVRDGAVYQEFFAKVDKSLFIERETMNVSSSLE